MKGALTKVLVAGLIGGGTWYASGYASNKVSTLSKYPIILPLLLIGIGILLARRGRIVSGAAIAAVGGTIGALALQIKMAQMKESSSSSSSAGLGDAGRRDSGLYDKPASAGALFGEGAPSIFSQQNALGDNGWGDAGALFGRGAQAIFQEQNALG